MAANPRATIEEAMRNSAGQFLRRASTIALVLEAEVLGMQPA